MMLGRLLVMLYPCTQASMHEDYKDCGTRSQGIQGGVDGDPSNKYISQQTVHSYKKKSRILDGEHRTSQQTQHDKENNN